ncbi:geranylgeranylglyceryl/heptaprenylglyceryl phosphate synthase [Streptomyces sp. NPDC003077]|uniref:geranylgeranylglyceryl/heptaprenylglyceryl phosphate synthase n=1 Tax=Streptomyces sp. NPDC003077 TaxID=3154443 RepID=UPI0033B9A483
MNTSPLLARRTKAPAAPPLLSRADVLARLRNSAPGPVHIIDPFKVPQDEAVRKAEALDELGYPALILASTDYESFESRMDPYVAAVKEASSLPVLLHFPPRKGIGFPLVRGADAIVLPALLGSRDDYYVWKSYLETLLTLPARVDHEDWPELLLTVALTFGEDSRTGDLLGTEPVATSTTRQMDQYLAVARSFGFHMVYLYSRNAQVPVEVVRHFRKGLDDGQILFVSGNVRRRAHVTRYLEAGADFVGFAGALEHPDWRDTLAELTGRGAP